MSNGEVYSTDVWRSIPGLARMGEEGSVKNGEGCRYIYPPFDANRGWGGFRFMY